MLEAVAWPAKGHKYAFLSFLTASAGRAYMRNPSGILAKNDVQFNLKPWAFQPL